ncbi:cell division cycle-associated 7-like protein [Saccoglossus kowalevskii]|uniref:Cell division cycle-associated 7-like protein-like n=1 Tax=Saccoglossus kowalevskii TaxID=10224 RepID=A0ABM0M1T5_SACKO|nr:PREDICTED: cell division cycle-associated 7-like protein-like [Saccoglossus kowalevskii]
MGFVYEHICLQATDLSDCESDGEETSYERKRQLNIKENQAMLNQLLAELKKIPGIMPVKKATPKTSRRSFPSEMVEKRRNPPRSARASPPKTRSRTKRVREDVDENGDDDQISSKKVKKLFIRFGPSKTKLKKEGEEEDADEDGDWEFDELPQKRRYSGIVIDDRTADEITDEDLDMVANSVAEKNYDSINGKSCHQCRQKTDDMKTICRSGVCFGVRGQFCGPCLRNRYGEDAKKALKDPNWACPPCRGVCNCSFCRKKTGHHATGILIHLARHSGYDNVKQYLDSFKV